MSSLRIAIIDPVGIKAGLDHYDVSLANALELKSCSVKIYSNFNTAGQNSIKDGHFGFTFKNGPVRILKLFSEFTSALRKSKKGKTEIVILHLFHSSYLDFLLVRLTKLFEFKICLIIHDIESLINSEKMSWIAKCVSSSYRVIVHNTISRNELAERIRTSDLEKISVVPHGNYLSIASNLNRSECLNYFNLSENNKYVLFFGMIKKSKGLDVLIDAMKNVSENVHLIIAGRSRDISFRTIEDQISKANLKSRIHIINRYITNDERDQLFNLSDIIVLPYRRIYQSGVLLMAMSVSLPVIISDLPANKLIVDGNNGILFNDGDSSDLASKMKLLISDDAEQKRLSENAVSYVTEKHSWNKIAEQLISILN